MKTKNKLFIVFLLCSIISFAQETNNEEELQNEEISIKPLRIGVKLGAPSLFTANIEYVTPLFDNRVAIILDYMSLSHTIDEVSLDYNNFEIGTNIYLKENGKGLYGSITYFSFKSEGVYEDAEFDDFVGEGRTEINFNTINFKIGAKLGNAFFFRIEAGYGFGEIPETITVTSTQTPETIEEEIPDIPGISSSGAIVFNFGIGFAFL